MKVYLASRYSRNAEMRGVRDVLEAAFGYEITSRWIDLHPDVVGDFSESFDTDVLNKTPELCAPLGQHDLDDIDRSDCVISFTGNGGKGGRHVEFGYALARGKKLFVVGPREHIFHTHPSVTWIPNWSSLVIHLGNKDIWLNDGD